ncbi:MAG: NDP-hexose 4-ketoreductase, partial [Coriobacteriales bacterium]|nr:NDP-hexose 4-ketoreductase [Coriobacteriales bacterium]
ILQIVDIMVADLRDRLIMQNMTINLTDAAKKYIASQGTDAAFGARPLRRAIQRLIEDPVSEELLMGRWKSGSVIDVDYDGEKLVFNEGEGEIPEPRKRQSMTREAELVTPFFKKGSNKSTPGDSSADE